MSDVRRILDAQLGAQWEIAKGHLRAAVQLSGSGPYAIAPKSGAIEETNYDRLKVAVEDFIRRIEDEGLHEL